MNCKEANEILITDFLLSQGVEPKKISGNSYWYLSPFRDEKTPSFKVNISLNRWYDFGIGIGGKLVDLGVRMFETDVSKFLERIKDQDFSSPFSFQQPIVSDSLPIILKIKKIENKALLSYLTDRAINPIWIAQTFCEEIYFSINNKNYFGIGFKNDLGGYEIRNKYFKGCIGAKGITTIKGKTTKTFVLFEGFMDFLTAYSEGGCITEFSYIILNSVNQIHHAIAELQIQNPSEVAAYFDNDEAGRKCFSTIKAVFPSIHDHSENYKSFKDVNEAAVTRRNNYIKSLNKQN